MTMEKAGTAPPVLKSRPMLLEQPQHSLAGLQREQVRGFLVGDGQRQVRGAAFQGVIIDLVKSLRLVTMSIYRATGANDRLIGLRKQSSPKEKGGPEPAFALSCD